jgi:hypothetical protein
VPNHNPVGWRLATHTTNLHQMGHQKSSSVFWTRGLSPLFIKCVPGIKKPQRGLRGCVLLTKQDAAQRPATSWRHLHNTYNKTSRRKGSQKSSHLFPTALDSSGQRAACQIPISTNLPCPCCTSQSQITIGHEAYLARVGIFGTKHSRASRRLGYE